ncbi:hypothetical protein GCM10027047_12260 [Rhodococcus aerolatus]
MVRDPRARSWRLLRRLLVVALLPVTLAVAAGQPASAVGSQAIGSGSTYAAIAIRQWISQAQTQGFAVNYTPSGSPTGLSQFAGGQADFAGTEAEYASVNAPNPPRGFQYVPDVAGATAIMYNLHEASGNKVDYLHLTRDTIAKIYIGQITNWSDPAISASNRGIVFPSAPINVVHRGGDSGTTALFYDFVAQTLGGAYTSWFGANCQGSAAIRPVNVVNNCQAAALGAKVTTFNDSEQIAQFVANDGIGANSIAFDEFGYAKKFQVPTAWVQNASGGYVLPYAENISVALEDARLRPDLSQDLSGVYGSGRQGAYAISAYSYLVTQCSNGYSTCAGPYSDPGKTTTLAGFMSYIACGGQSTMANLGYSPLPPNLSQEMANSVGRLTGQPVQQLNAGNCANPRFSGSLGAGASSPCDPFLCGAAAGGSSGGASALGAGGGGGPGGASAAAGAGGAGGPGPAGAGAGGAGGAAGAAGASGAPAAAATAQGADDAAGGGSDPSTYRKVDPRALSALLPEALGSWPVVVVTLALAVPIGLSLLRRRLRARQERA